MGHKGTLKAETELRVAQFVRIVANGSKRSDCVQYAAQNKTGVLAKGPLTSTCRLLAIKSVLTGTFNARK